VKPPDGGSVAAEAGHLAQDWSDSDDEPPSLLGSSYDSDSGKDSSGSDNADFFDFTYNSNRVQHDHHAHIDAAHQAAPGISSPRDGSWWWDTTESDWTVVGKLNPQPVRLSQKGVEDIFAHYLAQVEAAPPIDSYCTAAPATGGVSRY
jgi:hypothetical protein